MDKQDNLIYYEDALLTKNIIWTIEGIHQLVVKGIWRHVRIRGYEVDALAICDTAEGRFERYIGFELKDADLQKAIHQAKLRRKFFNYFYIVVDLPIHSIVEKLLHIPNFLDYKIGIISSKNNTVVLPSRFTKMEKWEYIGRKHTK